MEGIRVGIPQNPLTIVGVVVFLVGFIVFAVSGFASVQSTIGGLPDMSGVICGWVLAAVGMVIMVASRWLVRSAPIPPPPPIQQPMVPAGQGGPIGFNCPACGAPAENVDRFGVAVCTHCTTRFLVR